MDRTELYTRILREELVPALGCTEPISLAYAATACRELLGEMPCLIEASCSGNIIKNVMGVVIPNTNGMKGIETAVAVGVVGGDSSMGLEVLSKIGPEAVEIAAAMVRAGKVKVTLLPSKANLHFILKMKSSLHEALVEVIHTHMNIVRKELDGEKLLDIAYMEEGLPALTDRTTMTVKEIISYCEQVDVSVLRPIIEPQIVCNSMICQEGLEKDWGARIGKSILEMGGDSLLSRMKATAAAGSDARMSGCVSPVVINSGSGNQGIAVSMPVVEYARSIGTDDETLIRALAMSNLIAIHQKSKIGRLSAYCGAVNAAVGAGAAITWLDHGTLNQINETVTNTLASISGMICDGAKPSCAAKIALAVESAVIGHHMAMRGNRFEAGEGIVKDSVEATIDGVAAIASEGMHETDSKILSVMLR